MRFGVLNSAGALILLLNATAAQQKSHEPASADFRLQTEVSRSVVRAGLPVTVFANLTNRTESHWEGIRVAIEAYDEVGNPLAHIEFDGQRFDPQGSKSCKAVFRFQEPVQVIIRVTLTHGRSREPFFARDLAARIAVTPLDVAGGSRVSSDRDGCQ
ncbi:MAG TPA: hypothetical protein VKB79_23450 [Bryobacteraceae bacterium]|nr:hypothetical protein [Bryobacteraceae bacterium]